MTMYGAATRLASQHVCTCPIPACCVGLCRTVARGAVRCSMSPEVYTAGDYASHIEEHISTAHAGTRQSAACHRAAAGGNALIQSVA